jgi:hypothetical protein
MCFSLCYDWSQGQTGPELYPKYTTSRKCPKISRLCDTSVRLIRGDKFSPRMSCQWHVRGGGEGTEMASGGF